MQILEILGQICIIIKNLSNCLLQKKEFKLEASVLKNADCILTVSNSLKNNFAKKAKRVEVITNGFDDEVLTKNLIRLDKKFTISYIGLLPKQSNPKLLFKVLNALCLREY